MIPEDSVIVDIPKTGFIMWLLLLFLLVPAGLMAFLSTNSSEFFSKKVLIILLSIPMPLILFSLPRRYELQNKNLIIVGYLYRIKVPLDSIIKVEDIPMIQALLTLGSVFCSDPARALKISRKNGRPLIISPTNPEPFLKFRLQDK